VNALDVPVRRYTLDLALRGHRRIGVPIRDGRCAAWTLRAAPKAARRTFFFQTPPWLSFRSEKRQENGGIALLIKSADRKRQGFPATLPSTNLPFEGRLGGALALCFSDKR